jgi:hypothetical protein
MNNSEKAVIAADEIDIIPFSELARPFAAGKIRLVSNEIDFEEVVQSILDNHLDKTQHWITENLITTLGDDIAKLWMEQNKIVKAAVLAPWVFIQSLPTDN